MPLWHMERDARHPLILAGGVCAFLNPEPLAEIMDLFAVGEAEVLLPSLLGVLQQGAGRERAELLASLAQVPGLVITSYSIHYTKLYEKRKVDCCWRWMPSRTIR